MIIGHKSNVIKLLSALLVRVSCDLDTARLSEWNIEVNYNYVWTVLDKALQEDNWQPHEAKEENADFFS